MTVKSLDACQELAVVADADEDLGVRPYGGLKNREGTVGELVLLEEGDFELAGRWLVARLAGFERARD